MHEWAEIGDASHSLNYKPLDDITFDSIKIDGFEYSQSEGIIRDEHGIIKPLAIGEIYQYQILGDEITWLNIT